jgi:very-short-patch-repair endonuclease
LVIEVDGSIHEFQKGADHERQEVLERIGLHMLRISAELIEKNLSAALDLIRMRIRELRAPAAKISSPDLGEG